MRIRPFQEGDVEKINEIWEKYHSQDFSVPDRKNSVIDAVIEDDDGNLVAYGQVTMFAEGMFVLDKSISRRAKIESLKLLMLEAFRGVDEAGIDRLYLIIKDPNFATLMINQFGFESMDNPGELLLRKV